MDTFVEQFLGVKSGFSHYLLADKLFCFMDAEKTQCCWLRDKGHFITHDTASLMNISVCVSSFCPPDSHTLFFRWGNVTKAHMDMEHIVKFHCS